MAYSLLLVSTTVAMLFLSGCGAFILNPQKEFTTDPAQIIATAAHEDIFFASTDNVTLHGWLFRAKNPKGIVVFLHGYEDNISTQARSALWLVDAGYDVFAPDYRGHGRSNGSPTIEGINKDGLAAINEAFKLSAEPCQPLVSLTAASEEQTCKPSSANNVSGGSLTAGLPRLGLNAGDGRKNQGRVFVFGQSMGGAVAVWAAANSPHKDAIAALIIDAPFSSYRLIAKEAVGRSSTKWPLRYFTFLIDDSFSPIFWINRISPVPLLIIHGTQDEINLPYHSQRLFDAAAEPKELWLVDVKGHPAALTDKATQRRLIEYMGGKGGAGIGK